MKILYISYDGLLEPLGQSQVLAYQEKLAKNHDIHIISFEKKEDLMNVTSLENTKMRLDAAGVHWHYLKYHRRLSIFATSYDLLIGFFLSIWICFRFKIQIIHARSYVPSVIAITIKRVLKVKFIFDMRGFWADEKVDGGSWDRKSYIYSLTKKFEKFFLLHADHIVSLTHAGITEISKFPYIKLDTINFTVIPTCADLNIFQNYNIQKNDLTIGYVGSVGLWYNFPATLKAFALILEARPNAKLLIINRNEHDFIEDSIRSANLSRENISLFSSSLEDMPHYINQMHAGIFFINPLFSKQASAPTKLGEFLGCGVPCLSNHEVGDMASILETNNCGIAIQNFSENEIKLGVSNLLSLIEQPEVSEKCRKAAEQYFSLDRGVNLYSYIYSGIDRII